MSIHFAICHPSNDRITTHELEEFIARGELYIVDCRTMSFDFWDAIAIVEYDEERERKNQHYAESVEQITSLSEVRDIFSFQTYAMKDDNEECYWTCTIVTDENLSEWEVRDES